jgi:hypothetical protein
MGNGADPYGKSKSVVKFRVSRGQEHDHEYRLPGGIRAFPNLVSLVIKKTQSM